MTTRRFPQLIALGCLAVGLSACLSEMGFNGVRAVNVPADLTGLAVLPPDRPASPGPAPSVRIIRATSPSTAVERAEDQIEGDLEESEENMTSSTDLAMIAGGISALRTLEGLIGSTEADVRQLIGSPVMVAPRPPGIEWNYRHDDCVLQVYFFMEIATRDFRVLSYDLTGDNIDARRECASRILGQQNGPDADVAG